MCQRPYFVHRVMAAFIYLRIFLNSYFIAKFLLLNFILFYFIADLFCISLQINDPFSCIYVAG